MSLGTPDLHLSTKSAVKGGGKIEILSRADATHNGTAGIEISAAFDPAAGAYPAGTFTLKVSWVDSAKGAVQSTTIEQMNSWGRQTPTVVLTGRCTFEAEPGEVKAEGCRYWLLIANNRQTDKGTPDVVSVLVFDRTGARLVYGTGPLVSGDINVGAFGN